MSKSAWNRYVIKGRGPDEGRRSDEWLAEASAQAEERAKLEGRLNRTPHGRTSVDRLNAIRTRRMRRIQDG